MKKYYKIFCIFWLLVMIVQLHNSDHAPTILEGLGLALSTFVLVLGATIAACFVGVTLNLRRQKKAGGFGRHEYQIQSDGLFVESANSNFLRKWNGIQDIVQTAESIYVRIGDSAFFVIPRRAFEDDDGFQAFFDELRRRREEAARDSDERARAK